MVESARERDPVEQLADEFVSRCRRGETPSISDYVTCYPQYAEQIEALFPTVAMMEQYRAQEESRRRAEIRTGESAAVDEHLGDFRIVREIGRGGMDIVYEAEQKSLARRVALKVLPKHVLLLEKDRRRFQREAQTAARLRHTNIVPVFGMGQHDGLHYYVMPLVRGVGLDEVIDELCTGGSGENLGAIVQTLVTRKGSPPMPGDPPLSVAANDKSTKRNGQHWSMVARVGIQAAEALDYAHRQGTLHRDVKPSNLLADENGLVCVADFGLARAIDQSDASRTSEVVGTPRYVAPEQLSGTADARSDIYSLGQTLYELLTLRSALGSSDDRLRCSDSSRPDEPVPPRKLNVDTPRDLDTILLKCLAHQPEKRYLNAAALADDLRRLLDGRPILARPITWPQRAARWCQRNPAMAAMSTLAVLLLVAVGVTALTGHLRTRRAYDEATQALRQSEATSLVALDALDDIYLQLSPDRIWIQSGVDAQGEICVCLGLRSGGGTLSSPQRMAMQLHASEETANLLKGLLGFYDRLAEQTGDDAHVQLQAAIACRRVGDIRQLLGQLEEAQREYARAIAILSHEGSAREGQVERSLELARCHNELGNVQSVRVELAAAHASHRKALATLLAIGPESELSPAGQYELARTLYLLANKPMFVAGHRLGEATSQERAAIGGRPYSARQCRETATRILERLVATDPNLPDYQFLLALCLRPPAAAITTRTGAEHQKRAVNILERLKQAHPEVLEYRYELAITHAWVNVGLFPWQRPAAEATAEASLQKALAESRWLIEHNPSIPHYACSQALTLAKLAELRARAGQARKAESLFRQALTQQENLLQRFPELPISHRVVCEFIRLKLAQAVLPPRREPANRPVLIRARQLLVTCVTRLTQLAELPELAGDRLVQASLPIAHAALGQVTTDLGQRQLDNGPVGAKHVPLSTESGTSDPPVAPG